jgi:hypothetical protein
VWHLVDFLVCWMLLGPEVRLLILSELRTRHRPRLWRHARGEVLLIGA